MLRGTRWLLALLIGLHTLAGAQTVADSSAFCDPSVLGMPRPKGIVFKYERIPEYHIRSRSPYEGIANNQGEVDHNHRLEFKAKVPLWAKPNLSIAAGFKYATEKYTFDDPNSAYPFYQNLNGKTLKSIGGTLYVVKPFRGNRYFLLRAGGDLNGDYHLRDLNNRRFLRLSVSPLYGFKPSPSTTYAFGFSYNYVFGRSVVSPVLLYNRTFNAHWGLEMLLPASAKLRYSPNPHTNVYASAELNGANYTVRLVDPVIAQMSTMYLQRSEARLLLNYEREIYDFLWFGLEAGVRTPFNFSLAESVRTRRDPIIRNQLSSAMLFNASLFVVPPRAFCKKK